MQKAFDACSQTAERRLYAFAQQAVDALAAVAASRAVQAELQVWRGPPTALPEADAVSEAGEGGESDGPPPLAGALDGAVETGRLGQDMAGKSTSADAVLAIAADAAAFTNMKTIAPLMHAGRGGL